MSIAMRFPVLACNDGRMFLYDEGLVTQIGALRGDELQVNLNAEGNCELQWILDSDGRWYALSSLGMAPRLRIGRRRAMFRVQPPRTLSAGELLRHCEHLRDPFPEAPNAAELCAVLRKMPDDAPWTATEMRRFMGEG